MWTRQPAEQRAAAAQERRVNERIRRSALRDQIATIYDNPDRTSEDVKLARRLARQHNRSLSRHY